MDIAPDIQALADDIRAEVMTLDPALALKEAAVWMASGYLGKDDAGQKFGNDIIVEYLAGFVLSADSWGTAAPELQQVPNLITKARAVRDHFAKLNRDAVGDRPSQAQSTQAWVRFESLMDRMNGFIPHLNAVIDATFAPLADECRTTLGFSPADLPEVVHTIFEVSDKRYRSAYIPFMEELVDSKPADLGLPMSLEEFRQTGATIAVMVGAEAVGTITPDDLSPSGVPLAEIEAMLRALSSSPGCQPDFRMPFDANSFRLFPVMEIALGEFIAPMAWNIMHEAMGWFRQLCLQNGHETLLARFQRSRATAAEQIASTAMASVFGEQAVLASVLYDADGKQCELDVLVQHGNATIFCEAKSHRVTEPAWRGHSDRLLRMHRELIADAARQATRAENAWQEGRVFTHEGSVVDRLPDPTTNVKIVVSLDKFDALVTTRPDLGKPVEPNTWSVCATDLLMVSEILDTPAAFFAYAHGRAAIAARQDIIAFVEADLLAIFLFNPKAWDALTGSGRAGYVTFCSGDLNEYYTAIGLRREADAPPRPRMAGIDEQHLRRLSRVEDHTTWAQDTLDAIRRLPASSPR